MTPVRIGLLGFGTVGYGTWSVLTRNCDEIERRIGRRFEVSRVVVKDLSKPRAPDASGLHFTDDPSKVIDNPDIDIVIELMGGTNPAYEYIDRALANGKHIVTANKELIALRGNELFETAKKSDKIVAFEASVCGGIPIIKAVREGFAANRISSLIGIINGTCNYILSDMKDLKRSFNDVLEKAQELGYAEADPTFDVEGIDAMHKLVILASIAFGIPLQKLESIHCEGIRTISYDDIVYADELGFTIKHLAIARRIESGIEMRVHPSLVSKQRLLANVNGVMNAVAVSGDAIGRALFYGPGAGSEPTASAVIADLVDVARAMNGSVNTSVPHLSFQYDQLKNLPIIPFDQTETANYLRMSALNQAGVLAEVTRILGEHDISIESILQKSSGHHEEVLPVVIVTQETLEANMQNALEELQVLETVIGEINRIRIEALA